jgi:hypothetical protein
LQIDFVGKAQQANTISTAQEKGNATLFASMLSSVLNESVRTVGDFSDESDGRAGLDGSGSFLGQESFLASSQVMEGGNGNMLALMLMGLLLNDTGMGSELIAALLGAGKQKSLQNPFYGAEEPTLNADGESDEIGSFVQADGLVAYADRYRDAASPVPADAWIAVNPLMVSHVDERAPQTYRDVISQFAVETSERYRVNKRGVGDTYCNIFSWDVTRAMSAEIPHYVNPATGEPAAEGEDGAVEMDANATNDWLNTTGKQYGWVEVSAEQAQGYANAGMPAVTSWKNPGGHGHMQVVSPSEDGTYDAGRGVAIAQAGRHLYNYDYITSVYGQGTLGEVQYFAHI